jgi:hypothetical protein
MVQKANSYGLFFDGPETSTLIGANDPDRLDNPFPKLVVEAPHQVPNGIPEHAHEGG